MMETSLERDGGAQPEELFEPPEERFLRDIYEDVEVGQEPDARILQYAKASGGHGQSYTPRGPAGSEDMDILFSAYNGSRNVEGRGRMFRVDNGSGGNYHSMQVVCAFLRYKLDPELQRRMPGLDIHFRPDDGTTSFDIHSQYRRKNEEEEKDFVYA